MPTLYKPHGNKNQPTDVGHPEPDAKHQRFLERMKQGIPVDERPGNKCPAWLNGRPFRYLYRQVKLMRWCLRKFRGQILEELKELTREYEWWLAARRRPSRPRQATELIRDIGDPCVPSDDLKDPVPENDEYDLSDDFIDDSELIALDDTADDTLEKGLMVVSRESDAAALKNAAQRVPVRLDSDDNKVVQGFRAADEVESVPPVVTTDAGSGVCRTGVGPLDRLTGARNDVYRPGVGPQDRLTAARPPPVADETTTAVELSDALNEDAAHLVSRSTPTQGGRGERRARPAKKMAARMITALYKMYPPLGSHKTLADTSSVESPGIISDDSMNASCTPMTSRLPAKRPRNEVSGASEGALVRRKRKRALRPRVESDDEDEPSASDIETGEMITNINRPRIKISHRKRILDSDDERPENTVDIRTSARPSKSGVETGKAPSGHCKDEDRDDDLPLTVLRAKWQQDREL